MTPHPDLCRHSLADWTAFMKLLATFNGRMQPRIACCLLETAATEDGVPLRHAPYTNPHARQTERGKRQSIVRNWKSVFVVQNDRLFVRPEVRAQLGDRATLRSMARVLRQVLRQFGSNALLIGILVHACRPAPLHLGQINHLLWTRDFKNRTFALGWLEGFKLIRVSYGPQIFPLPATATKQTRTRTLVTGRVEITTAGRALLLGHWGRAIEPAIYGAERRAA